MELDVIRGAVEIIKLQKPLILMEWRPDRLEGDPNSNYANLATVLHAYQCYSILIYNSGKNQSDSKIILENS